MKFIELGELENVTMYKFRYSEFESIKNIIYYNNPDCNIVYQKGDEYFYNKRNIENLSDVYVLVFVTVNKLVEFLYHKNDMTEEKYLKMLGYPKTAIEDVLAGNDNATVNFLDQKIRCNSANVEKVTKELDDLYLDKIEAIK